MVRTDTADVITRFILEAKRRYSRNTVNSLRPLLHRLADAHDGELLGLDGTDIDRWLDGCQVQPSTRRTYITSLTMFYGWAVRQGLIGKNPADDATILRVPRAKPRPCRPAELEKALALADPKMKAWLCLMAYTGLRCCEVAALQVEDLLLHLDPPMIHVCHGTKGGHERVVPLSIATEEALIEYGLPRAGAIFRRPDSILPVSAGWVSHKTCQFLEDLGLMARPHQLRHFFATETYRQTGDIRAVQEYLGHLDPATTAIYADFSASAAAATVRRLGTPPEPA